jgi:hypothetical protein
MNGLITPSIASPLPVRSGMLLPRTSIRLTAHNETEGHPVETNSNGYSLLDFKH